MDIRKFLGRHYEIDQSINSKLEQIAELRCLAEKTGIGQIGQFCGSHGSGGFSDRVGRTAARIIDLENRINDEIDKLVEVKEEIREMIYNLPDSVQRTILERHYLLHEGWEKIADKLGYSPRHITRLHNQAIARLEEIYEDRTA